MQTSNHKSLIISLFIGILLTGWARCLPAETSQTTLAATDTETAPKFDPNQDYIIKAHKVKKVKTTFSAKINMPYLNVTEWILFTFKPPLHPTQELLKYQAFLNGSPADVEVTHELSFLKREMFLKRAKTDYTFKNHAIDFRIESELDLYARELAPGKYDKPIEELDEFTRNWYLRSSMTVDWDTKEFKSWLKEHPELTKNNAERDIAFGYKAYSYIKQNGKYSTKDGWRSLNLPSRLCRNFVADCGGFSSFFIALMRANGIPARALIGRWACNGDHPHCRMEFWAKGIGWVPADVNEQFGCDKGDFITFHVDGDVIIDTFYWNRLETWGSQGWLYWVRSLTGSEKDKSFEDTWTVEEIKDDE